MARTFSAEVLLSIRDMLSPGLNKAGKNVSRELNYMERGFRQLSTTGFGMVAGFTGFAVLTRELSKVADKMKEISQLRNELAAGSIKVSEFGVLKVLKDQTRELQIQAALRTSAIYNVPVAAGLSEQQQLVRSSLSAEQAIQAGGIMSQAIRTQNIAPGEMDQFNRSLIANLRDFGLPMGPNDIETSLTKMLNRMAEATTHGVTMQELNEFFKIAGPTLAATGRSFDEALSMAEAYAQYRIVGSEAGVAARSAAVKFQKPTKIGLAELARLGMIGTETETGRGGKIKQVPSTLDFERKYVQTMVGGGQSLMAELQKQFPGTTFGGRQNALDINRIAAIAEPEERNKELRDLLERSGATLGEDEDTVTRQIANMIMKTTTHVDWDKFMDDFIAMGGTQGTLAKFFEGRQSGREYAYARSLLFAKQQARKPTMMGDDRGNYIDETGQLTGGPGRGGEGQFSGRIHIPSFMEQQQKNMDKGIAGSLRRLETAFDRFAAILEKSFVGRTIEYIFNKMSDVVDAMSRIVRGLEERLGFKPPTGADQPITAANPFYGMSEPGFMGSRHPLSALESRRAEDFGVPLDQPDRFYHRLSDADRLYRALNPVKEQTNKLKDDMVLLKDDMVLLAPATSAAEEALKGFTAQMDAIRFSLQNPADLFTQGGAPMSGHLEGLPSFGGSSSSGSISRSVAAGRRAFNGPAGVAASRAFSRGFNVQGSSISPGDAVSYLMSIGATKGEAISLVSAGMTESGLNVNPRGSNDRGTARAMFQWHAARWNPAAAWALSQGMDLADPHTQLAMALHESRTSEPKAHAMMMAATNAAQYGAAGRAFERPGRRDLAKRIINAQIAEMAGTKFAGNTQSGFVGMRTPFGPAAGVGGSGVSPEQAAAFNTYGMVGGDASKLPPVHLDAQVNLDKERVGNIVLRERIRRGRRMATMDYPR